MDRPLVVVVVILAVGILLDEWAYHYWKAANPGHMWSYPLEPRPLSLHPQMSNYSDYVKGPPLRDSYDFRVRRIRSHAAW